MSGFQISKGKKEEKPQTSSEKKKIITIPGQYEFKEKRIELEKK